MLERGSVWMAVALAAVGCVVVGCSSDNSSTPRKTTTQDGGPNQNGGQANGQDNGGTGARGGSSAGGTGGSSAGGTGGSSSGGTGGSSSGGTGGNSSGGTGGNSSGGTGGSGGSSVGAKDAGAVTAEDAATDAATQDGAVACQPSGNDENCDGIDNDCDAKTDEAYAATNTTCGVGACAATGTTSCVSGEVVDSCAPGTKLAQTDTSCDGVDDDCDGTNDEEFVVVASCGVGACETNSTPSSCTNGVETACLPGTAASADTSCDGIDDDCDDSADEEYVPVATACGTGPCAATGATSCVNGHVADSCAPAAKLAATDTTCDGVDDDCDDSTDEDYAPVVTSCGVGACVASGSTSCNAGHVVDDCTPGNKLAPTDTTCDNVDDDCDNAKDEDYVSVSNCGSGVCRTGNTPSSCLAGVETACAPGAQLALTDTTCDGIDDDCSGSADEDYASLGTVCGVGACASTGATSCSGGHVVDSCDPGQPGNGDATCDGSDDDCDAKTDEDYVGCFNGSSIGGCVGGHVVGIFSCSDGFSCTTDSCIPATGSCDFAPSNAQCPADGYSCSKELCVANTNPGTDQTTGCTQVFIDAECPDATFCNGSEVCDPAKSNQPPGGSATGCAPAPLANRPCDPNLDIDNVPCTNTICIEDGPGPDNQSTGHCESAADPTFCTDVDGQYCNGTETCAPGPNADADGCVAGVNPCGAVPACALRICNATGVNTGSCDVDYKPGYSCGDLDPCTTDACDLNANPSVNPTGCTHVLRANCAGCTTLADCVDPYSCTVDSCLGDNTCAHDASACQCFTNADCNDGKACTTDTCNSAGQCVHVNDDAYCANQDLGQGGVCNGADTCAPSNNAANAQGCVHANAPLVCNDGLACTTDSCDPTAGCQHAASDLYCALNDALKCDGTATCDPNANAGANPSGCTNPVGFVACPDDGIACTTSVCVEVVSPNPGVVPSSFRCGVKPNDAYCLAQPGGCGSICQPALGCVKTCKVATCQGKTYQCGDCVDNDGDCRIDTGADPDCLGPCSNNEAGFHGDISGQNNAPCKMDCYFDQDTGAGNDDCYWSHSCDPLEVAPNYPPEDNKCAYNANANVSGTNKTCAQLMAINPPGQSTACWQAGAVPVGNGGPNYCGNLVPNGCDCFGCCAVAGVAYPVYLGSEDAGGNGTCSLATLTDPNKCKPCTQVPSCLNTCEHCELCVGKTTLPDDCSCQACPAGQQLCGEPCGAPCPSGYFCNTGCCAPVPT